MIKSVTAVNYLGEAITMNLVGPDESGFEVRDIQGLGPVPATINQSKISTLPGVSFNSATVGGRNIVLTLGLLAAPTVEEARQKTYRYFPSMQEVTLFIETDKRVVSVSGRVETNESAIFSRETAAQISILCDDAYFYDAGAENIAGATFFTTAKKFEFPFSNESLVEPRIELGEILSVYARDIDYPGDAEVGINIHIRALGPVQNLAIYNERTNEAVRISHDVLLAMTGNGIVEGDVIEISTTVGQKTAMLTRNGLRYNILNALGRGIVWPKLRKGRNTFSYTATAGATNVQIRIESLILYEGV